MVQDQKIPTGYKDTNVGVIPNDWEVKRLGDIGDSIIGLTYSPSDVANSGLLVHRSSNIQDNKLSYLDNVYVKKKVNEKLILREKDILICVRNGSRNLIGKSALILGKSVGETFGAFMSVYRTDKYQEYIFYLITSDVIQSQINQSLGATINQITNKTLNDFVAPFPSDPKEAGSISKVLFNLDSLIAKLSQLIQKKRNTKQGAMQELLTGKRRLPGFSGQWKKTELGVIAEILMGQSPLSKYYNKQGNGIPLIQGNADISNRKTIKRVFTTSTTRKGKAGDIIMSVRAPVGEVSRTNFDACLGRGVCAIRYENNYLYHAMVAHEPTWKKLSSGSTFDSVTSKDVRSFEIYLPNDKHEQTAIAGVLSDMDTEIESLEKQKAKYIDLKQGMMQQLLTGKIRLI